MFLGKYSLPLNWSIAVKKNAELMRFTNTIAGRSVMHTHMFVFDQGDLVIVEIDMLTDEPSAVCQEMHNKC